MTAAQTYGSVKTAGSNKSTGEAVLRGEEQVVTSHLTTGQ